ncbi:MAG: universal stress protein [Planctomycetota bacterium]
MERFKNILCYLGNDDTDTAIEKAIELSEANRARLTVMDVIRPMPRSMQLLTDTASPDDLDRLVLDDHQDKLHDRLREYRDTGVEIQTVVRTGDAATEIVREVLDGNYDLVIKTADGFSVGERLFGSVSLSVLRSCPCPVWALKPDLYGAFDRIVVALDLDSHDEQHCELNRQLLDLSYSLVDDEQTQLHLVSAWEFWMEGPLRKRAGDAEVNQLIKQREAKMQQRLDDLLPSAMSSDRRVRAHLQRGTATSSILAMAASIEADLVVMGTVSRSGLKGFLIGNTAESVISELRCSLLALKPPGFVSPMENDESEWKGESTGSLPFV